MKSSHIERVKLNSVLSLQPLSGISVQQLGKLVQTARMERDHCQMMVPNNKPIYISVNHISFILKMQFIKSRSNNYIQAYCLHTCRFSHVHAQLLGAHESLISGLRYCKPLRHREFNILMLIIGSIAVYNIPVHPAFAMPI